MSIAMEEIGELSRIATVTIPGDDFEKGVVRELKKLSSRVKLRGFRKGKIPLRVLRQNYGESVKKDVIDSLIRKHLGDVVASEDRLLFMARPEVTSIPVGGNGDLEFKVELELRPNLDPIGYLGLDVEQPKVEVDNEVVDAELEALREKFVSLEPIEGRTSIEEGDVVTVHFEAVDQEDEALQNLRGEDVEVVVGQGQTLPGISEALVGAELGCSPIAMVSLPEEFQVEELAGREVELRLDIQSVKARVLPELDDDFAIDTGEAETLEELRGQVVDRVRAAMEKEAANFAKSQLLSLLLTQNSVSLPPKFVDEQVGKEVRARLQSMQHQGVDWQAAGLNIEEMHETVREEKSRQLQSEFLLMAIANKEGLAATEDDLDAYFQDQASGIGVTKEQFEAYIRGDQERLEQAKGTCLLHKTVDHLLTEASITEINWEEAKEKADSSQRQTEQISTASADEEEPPASEESAEQPVEQDAEAAESAEDEAAESAEDEE